MHTQYFWTNIKLQDYTHKIILSSSLYISKLFVAFQGQPYCCIKICVLVPFALHLVKVDSQSFILGLEFLHLRDFLNAPLVRANLQSSISRLSLFHIGAQSFMLGCA